MLSLMPVFIFSGDESQNLLHQKIITFFCDGATHNYCKQQQNIRIDPSNKHNMCLKQNLVLFYCN